MAAERIIGIDFGTSTSVIRVKRYEDGKPLCEKLGTKEVIFPGMSNMVPTVITKSKENPDVVYYGHEALFRRRNMEQFHSFKLDLENADPVKRDQARALTEEFFCYLAKTYKAQSEGGYLGDPGDKERTIVSNPVKWSEENRQFMIAAARKAGFPDVTGMDEAQAAIQAVTIMSEDHLRKNGLLINGEPCNILLIDMGAGTTDLVLCRYTPGADAKAEILSTWPKEGEILFGGREVDSLLQDYFRNMMDEESANLVFRRVGLDKFKSWKEAVVSPALMHNDSVSEFLALDQSAEQLGIDMDEYCLDRAKFEKCLESYLKQFPKLISSCLVNVGIDGGDIDLVIATGDHSRWYFVKEMLEGRMSHFGSLGLTKIMADPARIIQIDQPKEMVARGLVFFPLKSIKTIINIGEVHMGKERVIGIDFGTSTSVIRVKRYENGSPIGGKLGTEEFKFRGDTTTVPTLIRKKEDNSIASYYGNDAKSRKKGDVIYRNFKMDLESSDPEKRRNARELTKEYFCYLAKEYRNNRDGGFLGDYGDKERTVVSYPVKWSKETRQFMLDVAKQAGFPNVTGIDEAQAAIQAVTVMNEEHLRKNKLLVDDVSSNVLLIDMGAGTTDLILCCYTPGVNAKVEILGTWPNGGNTLFGGSEVDALLQNNFFGRMLDKEKAEETFKRIGEDKFKAWKEEYVSPVLARGDSLGEFSELDNCLSYMGIELDYYLNRSVFEDCLFSYLKDFPKLINGCLTNAGINSRDIDLAIVTGGHSQWYFVKEMLAGKMPKFGKLELAKLQADPSRIIQITRPQETVALGLVYGIMNPVRLIPQSSRETPKVEEKTKKNLDTVKPKQKNAAPQRNIDGYRKAAEYGDADAQFNLAQCYESGTGVDADAKRAVYWYLKAAKQGHVVAQTSLGLCYDFGEGVNVDAQMAVYWYRKAAEQGYAKAQFCLGASYENGTGVDADVQMAVHWYRKAAMQGDALAQCYLGNCYLNGNGVNADSQMAVYWYRKSAEQGNSQGQCCLGICYEDGDGIGADSKMAVHWYRKAAEQGYEVAQYCLAHCYEHGNGINKDVKMAVHWYRKAAEQGYDEAQTYLGFCYEHGKNVATDAKMAVHWYCKAAEQGHEKAQLSLGYCYTRGIGVEKDLQMAAYWYQMAEEAQAY